GRGANLPWPAGQLDGLPVARELHRADGQVAPPRRLDDRVVIARVALVDPVILHDRRSRIRPEEVHGRSDACTQDEERKEPGHKDHRLLRPAPRPAPSPGRAVVLVVFVVFVVLVGRPRLPPGGLILLVLVLLLVIAQSRFRPGRLVLLVLVVAADRWATGPVFVLVVAADWWATGPVFVVLLVIVLIATHRRPTAGCLIYSL